jgi:hypothetical protein
VKVGSKEKRMLGAGCTPALRPMVRPQPSAPFQLRLPLIPMEKTPRSSELNERLAFPRWGRRAIGPPRVSWSSYEAKL